MTIAQAFNEITIAQGGKPNDGGTITGAIDALNDTLAGSDQAQGRTIEDAVRLLGQHIGGGSSVTVEPLNATENKTYTAPEGKAYSPVTVNVSGGQVDVGNLVGILATTDDMSIGDTATFETFSVLEVRYGDTMLISQQERSNGFFIAANLTALIEISDAISVSGLYVATLDESNKYASVEELTVEYDFNEYGELTFTVPDLFDDPDNPANLFIKFATE